ncbi:hypothetical protein ACOMHN_054729 [Nucella lapillus]
MDTAGEEKAEDMNTTEPHESDTSTGCFGNGKSEDQAGIPPVDKRCPAACVDGPTSGIEALQNLPEPTNHGPFENPRGTLYFHQNASEWMDGGTGLLANSLYMSLRLAPSASERMDGRTGLLANSLGMSLRLAPSALEQMDGGTGLLANNLYQYEYIYDACSLKQDQRHSTS